MQEKKGGVYCIGKKELQRFRGCRGRVVRGRGQFWSGGVGGPVCIAWGGGSEEFWHRGSDGHNLKHIGKSGLSKRKQGEKGSSRNTVKEKGESFREGLGSTGVGPMPNKKVGGGWGGVVCGFRCQWVIGGRLPVVEVWKGYPRPDPKNSLGERGLSKVGE